MKPILSVIIPCYNCEQTLREAFDSCFRQNIPVPFEIVMVDDHSTDNTRALMKELASRKKDVVLGYHNTNLGGGATRNTAVKMSSGEVIFCLDSDDIIGDGTLGKMYKYLKEKNSDGVGIEKSIKFRGKNVNDVMFVNKFGYTGEIIPIHSLIEKYHDKMCPLYSTFMITKKAFKISGGYPENHGFDTQGLAWRFLSNGLIAYTCPETTYLHRIKYNKSYYLREYESGKINHNWYKILEEFLYLFDEKVGRYILDFDFNNSSMIIIDELKKKDNIFRQDVDRLIQEYSPEHYAQEIKDKPQKTIIDEYWIVTRNIHQEKIDQETIKRLEKLVASGVDKGYIHLYLKQCLEKTGLRSNALDEKKVKDLLSFKKQGSRANLIVRVARKIKKMLQKNA